MSKWQEFIQAVAPEENRVLAAVAFVRTFGQTLRGSTAVGALFGSGLTAAQLISINWEILGWTVLALVGSATIAGLDAFFNNLANGLNPKYAEAVKAQIDK